MDPRVDKLLAHYKEQIRLGKLKQDCSDEELLRAIKKALADQDEGSRLLEQKRQQEEHDAKLKTRLLNNFAQWAFKNGFEEWQESEIWWNTLSLCSPAEMTERIERIKQQWPAIRRQQQNLKSLDGRQSLIDALCELVEQMLQKF